jgi:hypothetical protein
MSQFNSPAYEIARTSGQCAFTGKALEPGESYMAALVEVDPADDPEGKHPGGLKRLDVSMAAWEQNQQPVKLFSFWKTTVAPPNAKKKLFVDDDVLLNLLARLADTQQPQRLAFRFVLALILLRKKMLRYDGTVKKMVVVDGQEVERPCWRMTPKLDPSKGIFGKWNDAVAHEVLDPQLGDDEIAAVTQQLGEILEAEL